VPSARRVREDVSVGVEGGSNVEATLDAYERGIAAYVATSPATPPESYLSFRDAVLDLLPPHARMLELGSGPGHDAEFFASNGVEVHRTDAALGFVDRLRAAGYRAEVLDVTVDGFGGPFDIVFANAVLLHLTVSQFGDALAKAAQAVIPGGLLAFTVKEGDGEAWSTAKLDQARYFRYWQKADIQQQLARAGWTPLRIDRIRGRLEPWLYVISRRRATAEPMLSLS
jgi:SAM-dependent methyltransferase